MLHLFSFSSQPLQHGFGLWMIWMCCVTSLTDNCKGIGGCGLLFAPLFFMLKNAFKILAIYVSFSSSFTFYTSL